MNYLLIKEKILFISSIIAIGNGGDVKIPFFYNRSAVINNKIFEMNLIIFQLAGNKHKDESTTNGLIGSWSLIIYYIKLNSDKLCVVISETPPLGTNSQNSITSQTKFNSRDRFFGGSIATEGNTILGQMYFNIRNIVPLLT
ncbi:MAG: hypothetical protein V1773_11090 [bacterium]